MKKFLCLILCLLVCSAAVAEVEYSLPEKWQRQVEFGNGIKGEVVFTFSGDAAWAKLLSPLNGTPLQLRAIHAEDRFQYKLYAEDGEAMVGLTQLYGDGQAMYLSSELLPETLLTLVTGGDALDKLTNEGGNLPALWSAMGNIMSVPETSWETKWQPALATYETALELWMEGYASAPSVKRDDAGNATVLVRYDIPADAAKEQIKALWSNVLADQTLLPLLKAQMTDAQQAAYLDANWKYYYDQVIDGLTLAGNIVMERELTPKGEAIRTDVTLPLNYEGFTGLTISQNGTSTTVALTGDEKRVTLNMNQTMAMEAGNRYEGTLTVTYADAAKKNVAVRFVYATSQTQRTDEDTRGHLINSYTLKLQPAEGNERAFEPVDLSATVHIHSKGMQYNPVSLDVEATLATADGQASMTLDTITRSPWVLDELPTEGATDVSAMPAEDVVQKLTDLGMNGLTKLLMMNQETAIPVPEEATSTDLASASDL